MSSAKNYLARWFAVPCLLGLVVVNVPQAQQYVADAFVRLTKTSADSDGTVGRKLSRQQRADGPHLDIDTCRARFDSILRSQDAHRMEDLSIGLHRNGEADVCGTARVDIRKALWNAYLDMAQAKGCPSTITKYHVDSMLTNALHAAISSCSSVEDNADPNDGFYGYCDMGPSRTPVLSDHAKLIPNVPTPDGDDLFLPCHFHTREGRRLTRLCDLVEFSSNQVTKNCQSHDDTECIDTTRDDRQVTANNTPSLELYAVPAGRVFMFAPKFIGEIFELPHVEGSEGKNIYLEVLNLNPRVFDVFNFFSREESDDLVANALQETRDSHRIKRSSTGATGYNLNSRRTSESGFDTGSPTAMKVKRRCFAALGFDEYIESHADGLQILRYNLTTAYNSHLDWIEDSSKQVQHDYESGGKGGNRFATILMYMSDLGEDDGGETVFTKAPSTDPNAPKDTVTALEQLRASERGSILKRGSWEESMTAKCRTQFSVRPHSSRAVLFYSQHPNGRVDRASLHGACPILGGDKYAANLWVWNTPRQGYPGAPKRGDFKEKGHATDAPSEFRQITATFRNLGTDPSTKDAKLYFRNKFWADVGHGSDETNVYTYDGNVWTVRVGGKTIKSWTISDDDGTVQTFDI